MLDSRDFLSACHYSAVLSALRCPCPPQNITHCAAGRRLAGGVGGRYPAAKAPAEVRRDYEVVLSRRFPPSRRRIAVHVAIVIFSSKSTRYWPSSCAFERTSSLCTVFAARAALVMYDAGLIWSSGVATRQTCHSSQVKTVRPS